MAAIRATKEGGGSQPKASIATSPGARSGTGSVHATTSTPVPHPGEVMDFAWVDPTALAPAIAHAPWAFSPWLVLQARLLPFLGGTLDERGAIAS